MPTRERNFNNDPLRFLPSAKVAEQKHREYSQLTKRWKILVDVCRRIERSKAASGGDDERRPTCHVRETLECLTPGLEEVVCVFRCRLQSRGAVVVGFGLRMISHTVILEAGESTMLRAWKKRGHVIPFQVEADVPIKIPITRISGIPALATPDLLS